MKRPSNAQARVLAFLKAEEAEGRTIWWRAPRDPGDDALPAERWRQASHAHPSHAVIARESMDREANTSHYVQFYDDRIKHRSLIVCVREGWISTLHKRVFASGARGFHNSGGSSDGDRTTILRQLDLTEDGVIALGLWHEHRANTPTPLPTLEPQDRAVIGLAQQALTLGYQLVPRDDAAKQQARRLARAGWAQRGWVGRSTSSVLPTATALVELHPEHADQPYDRAVERWGQP